MPEMMNQDHFQGRYLPIIRLPPISDVTAMNMVALDSFSECGRSFELEKGQTILSMDPNVASVSGGRNSTEKHLRAMPCKPRLSYNGRISRDSSRASSVLSSSENLQSPRLSPRLSSGPQSLHLSPRASPHHSPRRTPSPNHLPPGVTTYKATLAPGVQVSPRGTSKKGERLHTRYLQGRVTWLNNLIVTNEPRRTSPGTPRHRQLNAQGEDGQLQSNHLIQKEEGERYWASMSTEAQLAMQQCRGEELGLQ